MTGKIYNRKIVLKDGSEILATGFGSSKNRICELVFNTSMVGYQEILSDNSYCKQGIVMTYPLIGNYGINDLDFESVTPVSDAIIVSTLEEIPSHYRSEKTLDRFCADYDIVGLSNVDTRMLTRYIRDNGSQTVNIVDVNYSSNLALKQLNEFIEPNNQVSLVSTQKPYRLEGGEYKIVAIDCGIKLNILRELKDHGFDVVVVPYNTTPEEVLSYNPDGLFLSNGPGNPEDAVSVIELVQNLQDKLPIFGICLGHQIIALANNCEISKMKFGHRGANHPVKNLLTGKIEITSQNHSYSVSTLNEDTLECTHINVLDNTIEGLRHKKYPVFSVQYHPESAPGPVDSIYLFEEFKELIKGSVDA